MRIWRKNISAVCGTLLLLGPCTASSAADDHAASLATCVSDLTRSLADPTNAVAAQYVNPIAACEGMLRSNAARPPVVVSVLPTPAGNLPAGVGLVTEATVAQLARGESAGISPWATVPMGLALAVLLGAGLRGALVNRAT